MRKRITKGKVRVTDVIEEIRVRERKYTELLRYKMSVKRIEYKQAKADLKADAMFRQISIL